MSDRVRFDVGHEGYVYDVRRREVAQLWQSRFVKNFVRRFYGDAEIFEVSNCIIVQRRKIKILGKDDNYDG